MPVNTQSVAVMIDEVTSVSGLLSVPFRAKACYVLAHGAGAGMHHPFMAAVAAGLAEREIATLRYQFPYMERGSKRPDAQKIAHATVRAAVGETAKQLPGVPLIAGGKSFGGRMTSQAQSAAPLPGVRGLVFLGFPLHPANKPARERGDHLFDVRIPMLFLQGTHDALAERGLIERVCKELGARARVSFFEAADHSFHVPARSGRKDSEVLTEVLDACAAWVGRLLGAP